MSLAGSSGKKQGNPPVIEGEAQPPGSQSLEDEIQVDLTELRKAITIHLKDCIQVGRINMVDEVKQFKYMYMLNESGVTHVIVTVIDDRNYHKGEGCIL